MEILQTVKQIGVFMICAQVILHFKPSAKYGKYLKLLISVMVLVQIITSVVNLLPGEDNTSFLTRVREIQIEIDNSMEQLELENAVNEKSIINTTLEEIKTRINKVIRGENLQVKAVEYGKETDDKLIFYLEEYADNGDIRIEVDRISIGDMQVMGRAITVEMEENADNVDDSMANGILEQDKLQVLYNALITEFGISESQVEVVWYG